MEMSVKYKTSNSTSALTAPFAIHLCLLKI